MPKPSLPLPSLSFVSSQRGAGLIEFTIVALPVLLLILGSIELASWFYTRQAISLALLDAGRAAITDHNRPSRIVTSFEAALRPLFAATSHDATVHRLNTALTQRQQRMHDAPWKIEVLSPAEGVYRDFSDPGLRIDGASGYPAINNHYLAEQDARYRARGWHEGRGPVSGQTIFQANTVVLRLNWLHEARLPLIIPLLRVLGNPHGNYRQRAWSMGYIPMTRQITLMMQSHPVKWSNDPDGKVIYPHDRSLPHALCKLWQCDNQPGHPPMETAPGPGTDPGAGTGTATPDPLTLPAAPDSNAPHPQDSSPVSGNAPDPANPFVDPDDPVCGVALCCV